ncbi:hypothetical protein EAG_12132 [Camponotus floridanus]|uniref:Uncharacterized protein n=1 Tax=Camponotus floridanus TaxID=104421 RepID=E2B0G6_CAMFO|nr:hypothetical protein EAG_12132 [Camponotus floridanus]
MPVIKSPCKTTSGVAPKKRPETRVKSERDFTDSGNFTRSRRCIMMRGVEFNAFSTNKRILTIKRSSVYSSRPQNSITALLLRVILGKYHCYEHTFAIIAIDNEICKERQRVNYKLPLRSISNAVSAALLSMWNNNKLMVIYRCKTDVTGSRFANVTALHLIQTVVHRSPLDASASDTKSNAIHRLDMKKKSK